jgi:hypothetical protein
MANAEGCYRLRVPLHKRINNALQRIGKQYAARIDKTTQDV